MIEKKNLRIGNLVSLSHESNALIATVFELKNKVCIVTLGETNLIQQISYDLLMPIDLTKDRLKRIGLELNTHWDFEIKVGALSWVFRYNTKWYSELGGIYLGDRFKHVHQIQNIFFDLTGKELTIKEPANGQI